MSRPSSHHDERRSSRTFTQEDREVRMREQIAKYISKEAQAEAVKTATSDHKLQNHFESAQKFFFRPEFLDTKFSIKSVIEKFEGSRYPVFVTQSGGLPSHLTESELLLDTERMRKPSTRFLGEPAIPAEQKPYNKIVLEAMAVPKWKLNWSHFGRKTFDDFTSYVVDNDGDVMTLKLEIVSIELDQKISSSASIRECFGTWNSAAEKHHIAAKEDGPGFLSQNDFEVGTAKIKLTYGSRRHREDVEHSTISKSTIPLRLSLFIEPVLVDTEKRGRSSPNPLDSRSYTDRDESNESRSRRPSQRPSRQPSQNRNRSSHSHQSDRRSSHNRHRKHRHPSKRTAKPTMLDQVLTKVFAKFMDP